MFFKRLLKRMLNSLTKIVSASEQRHEKKISLSLGMKLSYTRCVRANRTLKKTNSLENNKSFLFFYK